MSVPSVDVVCIGNAIVDVISQVPESFIDQYELAKGSMTLIETDRAEELYAAMPDRSESSGGSAANTAVGIASLGGSVSYIGRVAEDPLGEFFRTDLRAAGVGYDVPGATDGVPTARSMIFVTPDAERTMNTYLGASGLIVPDDVDPEVAGSGKITFCEGYLWDRDDAKAAIVKGMEAARAAGSKVSFTLSDPFCVDRHRHDFRALLGEQVDIVFANELELLSLYEVDDIEAGVEHIRGHVEVAVVTRSELGSVVITADDVIEVAAEPVDEVVDTTGAGDLYAAGFLYGWAIGAEPGACARLGHIAAAEVISHVGARPLQPLSGMI